MNIELCCSQQCSSNKLFQPWPVNKQVWAKKSVEKQSTSLHIVTTQSLEIHSEIFGDVSDTEEAA